MNKIRKRKRDKDNKPCPPDLKDTHSMQESGRKDKSGKPIMTCQKNEENPTRTETKHPGPDSGTPDPRDKK